MEESRPLDPEDIPFYDAIKNEFETSMCKEEFCIRLTRAFRSDKKHRMQRTLAEARRIIDWRAQNKVDDMLTTDLERSALFNQCWPSQIYGEDYYGHIIQYDRLRDINLDLLLASFTIEQMLIHRAKHMERLFAE